ncbi:MAG: N-acetylmuramoyl-L-alanine amidase [Candidatus Kapabacteria bacterium]|nr:N-acetylmuramoyl-L-alanine amidase [Candidatus Kapabacteria bacterium]
MIRLLCALVFLPALLLQTEQSGVSVITSVRATSTTDSTTIRIRAARTLTAFQKPERTIDGFVVRIPSATIYPDALDSSVIKPPLGCRVERVRDILVLRFVCSTTDTMTIARDGQRDVVCTIRPLPKRRSEPESTMPAKTAGKWSLDVIVIDAGHGGQDAGAEGVNGVFEKDVTLAIAKKLRDLFKENMPSTKVVMTRDSDVFIELFRRTQIANEAGGKLFISIHCNSMPTKPNPAHGCETYILRPGRNDDAARVASRENSSVKFEKSSSRYQGMTEDQIIIATMAQRSFVRLSESFASTIQREVKSTTPLADRGMSQAGFFVLVGASMPNVLVETGFLSNTNDAEYLASAAGQTALARSLSVAVKLYAATYQRSMSH